MPEDPNTLFDEAKCFRCSSDASLSDLLKLALLQRIADSSGGGSQFISGAGSPAAAPSNPDAPAQYFDTTNDFTYNWNLGTQAWVPVPKVYRALLSQTGTDAPVATVLENTLGGTPVWTRASDGNYPITLNGAFPPETFPMIGNANSIANTKILSNEDGNSLVVLTAANDNNLYLTPVEILVYP